ncbi:Acetyl esterase/lipase [Agromyces sp. CF514]|uniref:alpha/beta hydrolase n=1 Tax=Agromyces sp. CF514 TaxID=1881031 RepID=UPI0008DEC12F|nr:alpha/beta hydrolase [Agromyces sp. CF514]SFR67756.1 Acetyl esterase/lipase [Agromyces sp. CF514]
MPDQTAAMTIDEIDPSLHAALGKVPVLKLENPIMLAIIGRASRLQPGTHVEGVERRVVHEGSVRVRVFTPEEPNGSALLWIHGGGLVMGSAAGDDRFCGETARAVGAVVVSVDYRLAPKHPFPAANDDVRDAYLWVKTHAGELGVDPARIAVGGASAGGGLAAALVQRLHDEGEVPAAQWLFCPMLDDRTAADRSRDARNHLVWNNRSNLVGWRSYLGVEPGAADVPEYAVPARRTDLSGLPPAWLTWTDIELFADEDLAYAQALAESGVVASSDVVAAAPHGFDVWGGQTELAQHLFVGARDWLARQLAAPTGAGELDARPGASVD